jgi:hypothetical protein
VLSDDEQRKIERAFQKQFPEKEADRKRAPRVDLAKFARGRKGSLEFTTHILDHPIDLWLKIHGFDTLEESWLEEVDATVRYAEYQDGHDATILDGTLCDVLKELQTGVPLDGNRSHGNRGYFDEKTTHGFELEWEVPEDCDLPDERKDLKLDFVAKPQRKPRDAKTRHYTVHAIDVEITYNSFGTHNPKAAMYVLEENLEAVREVEGVEPGTPGVDTMGIGEVMHGEFGALLVEPEGSEWLDPHTGEPIRAGSQAIIVPPEDEAYREFCLMLQDFAPLIDPDFDLDEQPDDPNDEAFVNPNEQHGVNAGVGAINYRNAPYYRRGADPDPAYVHSSWVHGDPETPTLETYPEDKVRIRLVHGPHEEQHNFYVHGLTLDSFGFDPNPADAQITAPSEAFTFEGRESDTHDFEFQNNPADLPIRDYLYGSTVSHDLWDGMWGIFRVFGREVDHLYPVPNSKPPKGKISEKELKKMGHPAPFDNRRELGHRAKLTFDEAESVPDCLPDTYRRRNEFVTGDPPPVAPKPGNPCPDAKRTLEYDVTAFTTRIDFNEYGDHDPHGIVYALEDHVKKIKNGERPTDPLLLSGNRKDCITLTLTNGLPEEPDDHDDHPRMRTPVGDLPPAWERSNRISLHNMGAVYDVNGSDGATVGFNFDQTIGPGESITYKWSVEVESTNVMWDMADMRSNRHHGAFGQFVVEPSGSKWLDSETGEPTVTGRQAVITGHKGRRSASSSSR